MGFVLNLYDFMMQYVNTETNFIIYDVDNDVEIFKIYGKDFQDCMKIIKSDKFRYKEVVSVGSKIISGCSDELFTIINIHDNDVIFSYIDNSDEHSDSRNAIYVEDILRCCKLKSEMFSDKMDEMRDRCLISSDPKVITDAINAFEYFLSESNIWNEELPKIIKLIHRYPDDWENYI